MRIGQIDLDTSHAGAFAEILSAGDKARIVAILPGETVMTAELTRDYAEKFGVEHVVETPEEMIGKVDLVLIQSVDWDVHLPRALPFLEAGIPVFLDKPLCGNLADCASFQEWESRGALIYGSSSLRYTREVDEYLALPTDQRGERFRVVYGAVGTDDFNYAIHVAEMLGGLLGRGFTSVRFLDESDSVQLYEARHDCGAVVVFQHSGVWLPFSLGVTTEKGFRHIAVDNSKLYATMLEKMLAAFENRGPLAGMADIAESVRLLLAAKLSRESGGREVALDDAGLKDVSFDGKAFADSYGPTRRASLLNK